MALKASDRNILPAKCANMAPYCHEWTSLTTNSRIKATNYNLSLFDLEFGGKWSYSGLVKIDSKIAESTDEIVINTKELDILSAEVFGADGNCTCRS